jgi:predicted SAM-dependent methyltransferase
MRALDLGAGAAQVGKQIWPECEVVTVDLDERTNPTVVADVRAVPEEIGKFDYVLASHVLEHLGRLDALAAVQHWASFLLPGGQLHVLVPDLEWACEYVVLSSQPPTVQVLMHLFGLQTTEQEYHKWGYTAVVLRSLLQRAGLEVHRLESMPYLISTVDGEPVKARQLYAICTRPE